MNFNISSKIGCTLSSNQVLIKSINFEKDSFIASKRYSASPVNASLNRVIIPAAIKISPIETLANSFLGLNKSKKKLANL